ncbi:MAG: class I SAM-dependent methyltransferase [Chloroflexi bacterium]|jgi:SAM-dependent methyltransferase|nr:class I SAM-dependent methyltransferase [Chloroflexota bacterium]
MRWQTKSFLQRILSRLNFGNSFYYQVQKHFGGFRHFSIRTKIDQGIELLEAISVNSLSLNDMYLAEIGTGWAPLLPMLFAFLGAKGCVTCDVNRLLNEKLVLQAAKQFLQMRSYLHKKLPKAYLEDYDNNIDSIGMYRNCASVLRALNITYFVDSDDPLKQIETASIDIFLSNDTLEHIPQEQLPGLFREIRRVLKPDGLMIHQVDCSDHYSHNDSTINRFNFLRFSTKEWARYNNDFLFQNRLRPSDYWELITSAGFSIDYWKQKLNQRTLEEFPGLPIAKEFQAYRPEELCVSDFIVLARPNIEHD